VRCSALQCVAVRCSALQCVAVRCSALQCVAVRCSAMQCDAVRCSECAAMHFHDAQMENKDNAQKEQELLHCSVL